MASPASLHLSLREPARSPPLRQERHGRGFSVERVVIEANTSFEYAWKGTRHYLALHDLRLRDGELFVDGVPPVRTRDLRDTLTFIPPGCGGSGWSDLGARRNGFTVLNFDPAEMDEDLADRFNRFDLAPRLYVRSEVLRAPLARLGDLLAQGTADPLHLESLAMLAIVELLAVAPPEAPGRLSPGQLAAAVDYVETHLAGAISLAELAAAAGLSRFHFSRAFKATTGTSPYAFALARRVDRAEELLAEGKPLASVAAATGFAGAAQLRRALRDRKGCSPARGG